MPSIKIKQFQSKLQVKFNNLLSFPLLSFIQIHSTINYYMFIEMNQMFRIDFTDFKYQNK